MSESNLDTDLFGFNAWGLAAYLEPDGWTTVNAMKRPQRKSYQTRTPRSAQLAEDLFDTIRNRRRWGHQLSHGGWTTYTEGEPKGKFLVPSRSTATYPYFVEPPAGPLSDQDLLKHLHGRVCAHGSTDAPVGDEGDDRAIWPKVVTAIRIDVDQDDAWLYERRGEILRELRDQRRIVEAMGLSYTAFRTGGRGFQAIIPLPCALTPTAASFLSRGLRLALRGRKGLTGVHVDRDSFDGLMRLPGGVHARGNTGLFIDLDRGELFSLEAQVEMIGSCLKPGQSGSSISEGELLGAEQQL